MIRFARAGAAAPGAPFRRRLQLDGPFFTGCARANRGHRHRAGPTPRLDALSARLARLGRAPPHLPDGACEPDRRARCGRDPRGLDGPARGQNRSSCAPIRASPSAGQPGGPTARQCCFNVRIRAPRPSPHRMDSLDCPLASSWRRPTAPIGASSPTPRGSPHPLRRHVAQRPGAARDSRSSARKRPSRSVPILPHYSSPPVPIRAMARISQRVSIATVVSREDTVRQIVARLQLGEGDAPVVHTTDTTDKLADQFVQVPLPEELQVVANYPIAVAHGKNRARGEAFVAFVESTGRAIHPRPLGLPPTPAPQPSRPRPRNGW